MERTGGGMFDDAGVQRAAMWELAGALGCQGMSGAVDPRVSAATAVWACRRVCASRSRVIILLERAGPLRGS